MSCVQWKRALFVLFAVLFAGVAPLGVLAEARAQQAPDARQCIEWYPSAVYRGFAWDHWVHVANHCSRAAQCELQTELVRQSISVGVPGNQAVDVVTFIGSPSRDFRATMQCEMRD